MEELLDALQAIARRHDLIAAELAAVTVQRNALIHAAHSAGLHLRAIARLSGVHFTRVRQILARPPSFIPDGRLVTSAELLDMLRLQQARVIELSRSGDHPPNWAWDANHSLGVLYRAAVGEPIRPDEVLTVRRSLEASERWRIETGGVDRFAEDRVRWLDLLDRLLLDLAADVSEDLDLPGGIAVSEHHNQTVVAEGEPDDP